MNESSDTNAGKRLGGYEIIKKVGQGGMGAVFEARQISMDRRVALKVLPPRLAADEAFVGRFIREARSLASYNTPTSLMFTTAARQVSTIFLAWSLCPAKPSSIW